MITNEILLKECIGMRNGEFLKHLKDEYRDTLQRLLVADEATVKRLQGDAQRLEALIEMIENSKDLLARQQGGKVKKRM